MNKTIEKTMPNEEGLEIALKSMSEPETDENGMTQVEKNKIIER